MNTATLKARLKELEQQYQNLQKQRNDADAEMRRLEGAYREIEEMLKISQIADEVIPSDETKQPTTADVNQVINDTGPPPRRKK